MRLERADHRLAVTPLGKLDDVDEPRLMVCVVGARHAEPGDVCEQLGIACRDLTASGQDPVELLELTHPDRRADAVDPIVEPEPCMVEPAAAVGTALIAQALEELPRLLRRRRYDPALTGGDLLVRVEGQTPRPDPGPRAARPL